MGFKEWCRTYYGIMAFNNENLFDIIFIPALPEVAVLNPQFLAHAGGSIINPQHAPEFRGLVIPNTNFHRWLELAQLSYYGSANPGAEFTNWLQVDIAKMGFDFTHRNNLRKLDTLQVTFKKVDDLKRFKEEFDGYVIELPSQADRGLSLQCSSYFVTHLISHYQKSPAVVLNSLPADSAAQQIDRLERLITKIEHYNLSLSLDTVRDLSRNEGAFVKNTSPKQAAEGFSLSLNSYISLHSDLLSLEEFSLVNYAINTMREIHNNGYLKPCLARDADHVNAIYNHLISSCNGELISEMSAESIFNDLIAAHVDSLLYGAVAIADGPQACSFSRFLPDENMQSATNELIVQAGGIYNNFSIYRIIKVGILANGNRSSPNEKPHFFKYFRVNYNLDYGNQTNPSVEVVITQLFPSVLVEDKLYRATIDPYREPQKYQEAMALTLTNLVRVERLLIFYKAPGAALSSPILFAQNDDEWQRLTSIKQDLMGDEIDDVLCYIAVDPLNADLPYQRTIQKQRYRFEPDKTPIFMMFESFISSIIGPFITACYVNFLRAHNGQHTLIAMQNKLAMLLTSVIPAPVDANLYLTDVLSPLFLLPAAVAAPDTPPSNSETPEREPSPQQLKRELPAAATSLKRHKGAFFRADSEALQLIRQSGISGAQGILKMSRYGNNVIMVFAANNNVTLFAGVVAEITKHELSVNNKRLIISIETYELLKIYLENTRTHSPITPN